MALTLWIPEMVRALAFQILFFLQAFYTTLIGKINGIPAQHNFLVLQFFFLKEL